MGRRSAAAGVRPRRRFELHRRISRAELPEPRTHFFRGSAWLPIYVPADVHINDAMDAVAAQGEMIDDVARGVQAPLTPTSPAPEMDIGRSFPRRRHLVTIGDKTV